MCALGRQKAEDRQRGPAKGFAKLAARPKELRRAAGRASRLLVA